MWLAVVAFGAAASDPLTVCITPDAGLNLLEGRGSLSRITSDQQVQGFDAGMRNEILTRRLQQPYNVRALGSYAELQVRTRLGECDIGWGMFHRTLSRERCTSSCPNVTASMFPNMTALMWEEQDASVFEPFRCCADYSAPPMKWAISVMYRAPGSSNFFLSIFQLLAEPFFLNFLSFIFLWIVIFAHAVWLAERRCNAAEFPANYLAGIDDAVWWAAVTISTVGYGDKSPKSPIGRLIALVLILFGLAMFSVLAGHMAGRFVELSDAADVKSASDVQNWRLCGYAEAFEQAVKTVFVVRVIRSHIWECGELLQTGEVDGMLMDQPAMAYYRAHNDWAISTPLVISPPLAEPTVGIIFPKDSPLRSAVSAEIVDYVGSRDHEENVLAWFPATLSDNLSNLQLSLVVPFACLVGLYVAMQVLFTIKGKASFLPAVQRALSPVVKKSRGLLSELHAESTARRQWRGSFTPYSRRRRRHPQPPTATV